ncbi:hypothetical protein OH492_20595 [Vibrio chagasii]|nr:hypothetical protein [Vibrio chagasii]
MRLKYFEFVFAFVLSLSLFYTLTPKLLPCLSEDILITITKDKIMTKSKTPMTPEAAARIQGNAAKQNGCGKFLKATLLAELERAVAHNQKQGK